MKTPRIILSLLVLLAGLPWLVPAGATPDDSAVIRQRIDGMLKRRQKPEPLPLDPPNPFAQISGASSSPAAVREPAPTPVGPAAPAATVDKPEEEAGSATATELLARLASRLRITGVIRVKNQLNVIINDNPWKEGDYLTVNQGARIIRLQVMRIQPGQLTLRLDDAELVLKF